MPARKTTAKTTKRPRLSKPWIITIIVVVVVLLAAGGYFLYQQYGPSKVTDPDTKAQLQKAADDLKSINLASVKSAVNNVNSVVGNFKKK